MQQLHAPPVVLIIALFTFPIASPHVHISLSDMMLSASPYRHPYDVPYKVQAQPPQYLNHELLAPDDTLTGLIAFITESWPSLWWGSICGIQYTQTHNVVL